MTAPRRPPLPALMKELLASIRAEVPDFDAFGKAIQTAMTKRDGLPEPVSNFLRTLDEAQDREALLRILNQDPVHDQVAVDRTTPCSEARCHHMDTPSCAPHADPQASGGIATASAISSTELEDLVRTPHPARSEQARIGVLDAITRLRRENERERCYLPTPMQYLEAKLSDYNAALKPKASEWLRGLVAILDRAHGSPCATEME